jgi:signal transduction histidine kinase/CheY-like chemotaxis protein
VAAELMVLEPEAVDDSICVALERVARRIGVQRGYVFLLTDDETALAGAVEWVADGVEAHDFEAFKGVPVTAFPWTMDHLRARQSVVVQDPAELPPEAAPEQGACDAMDINDYVNTGLFVGERLLGWLGFDSVGTHRSWSARDLRLVEAAAEVVAAGLERKRRTLVMRREREVNNRAAAVGTLAAGLAHEINNPLTFLLGNLAIVEEWAADPSGPPPADLAEMVEEMREGARRIERIVQDLRNFASGGSSELEVVDLGPVVDTTLRMARSELAPRARVEVDLGGVPAVLGSVAQLSQVLLNLLLNAAHAIPEGSAHAHTVSIVARAVDDVVELEVRDTGRGIAEADLPRIFDPFFTTRDQGMGMGVGLAISRTILRRLGGNITARSTPGVGTSMCLRLPRADGETSRPLVPDQPTVLVVDDEPSLLRWVRRVLSDYRVLTAEGGVAALELLADGAPPDVVLCDLMMPGMSGIEFYNTLRRELPELVPRVAFITGGVFSSQARDFLETVPNRVLHKPFKREDLHALIAELAGSEER